MRRLPAIIVLLLSVVGCQHTMSMAERAKAEQVVSGRLKDWAQAFSNRDVGALAGFYDQSRSVTVAWPDGRRTVGWREESAAQREFLPSASQVNLALRGPEIAVLSETVAVATFSIMLDVAVGNRRSVCAGPGMSVWVVNPAGEWRIRALQTACAMSR